MVDIYAFINKLFQLYLDWILRLINFMIDLIDYLMLLYLLGVITLHALRPLIDLKINHVRHFLKIPFINKGLY